LDGPKGKAAIENIDNKKVVLIITELNDLPAPKKPEITLICALPRPQTLKKILFTSAMMGVTSLHLIRSNRVEKSYFDSPLLAPENHSRFIIEGLMQGKLTRPPEIIIHRRFKPFVEDYLPTVIKSDAVCLLPEPKSDRMLKGIIKNRPDKMVIALGPEGGWVPYEIELMTNKGFVPIQLGPWILRVEHALTAILAQMELIFKS
jgi:RsmE family RNA methyltransferase